MIKYLRNMWLLTMLIGSLGHPVTGRVWSDVITSSVLGQHFARAAGLYLWDSVNIIITSHVLTAQLSLHRRPSFYFLVDLEADWKSWRVSQMRSGPAPDTGSVLALLIIQSWSSGAHCPGLSLLEILCQELSQMFDSGGRGLLCIFKMHLFHLKNLRNLSKGIS